VLWRNIWSSGLILGGADKICFVHLASKSDILEYFGYSYEQGKARLCGPASSTRALPMPCSGRAPSSACRRTLSLGMPDTVWFPKSALGAPTRCRSVVPACFRSSIAELFDAVVLDGEQVKEIQVKKADATSRWIWVHSACRRSFRTFIDFAKCCLCCGRSAGARMSILARW